MTVKTQSVKVSDVRRDWYVVDATDQVLGRLAAALATRLRGKHKPEYTPNVDVGDHIVVINAEKVKVTGAKLAQKHYHRHSGYPGGLKSVSLERMLAEHPQRAITLAVKGMLPRTPLGRAMARKLKVYAGQSHPHQSQQPRPLTLGAAVGDG